jgi:Fe-S oxidoreductase
VYKEYHYSFEILGLEITTYMLSLPEKILFAIAAILSFFAAYQVALRIKNIIGRGQGDIDWNLPMKRIGSVITKTITLQPVFRFRFWSSVFHGLIAWGFLYFLIVNLGDVLEAYISEFQFLGTGLLGNLYRLGADLLSVGTLIGMNILLIRRFILQDPNLSTRQEILLYPKARSGIRRDSAIVGFFIIFHVGFRFLGESFQIALEGQDAWQPIASAVSSFWYGMSDLALTYAVHISFWIALGLIFIFIPYFLYSKHIHLFLAPINFLFKPERRSIGELDVLDFEDENIEQFGVIHIEDLLMEQIMDAYACIMCNRCQEVCPAYNTGKVLSPASLEINKRYYLNQEGKKIANGESSPQTLIEYAIPPEAIWACTACGACVDICPVGNEPMQDILNIRRSLVLMDNDFPEQLQTAYRGMERTVNPWNISPTERMNWAEGLDIKTIEENPNPDLLWWVGCAPATDERAQKTARAFTQILNASNVNFSVLGEVEQCTGDSARRSGNEYLFYELAQSNIEILNEVAPKRIVTTCPHCLHTLKNEYPAYGGKYDVVHHTELINELFIEERLGINKKNFNKITFHDPCYLGRQNNIYNEPRLSLEKLGANFMEMPRHGAKSFCCGAGGGQMWKEEEHGTERVNSNRYREAAETNADILAVACPFCMVMLEDARKDQQSSLDVLDIAEIIAASIDK